MVQYDITDRICLAICERKYDSGKVNSLINDGDSLIVLNLEKISSDTLDGLRDDGYSWHIGPSFYDAGHYCCRRAWRSIQHALFNLVLSGSLSNKIIVFVDRNSIDVGMAYIYSILRSLSLSHSHCCGLLSHVGMDNLINIDNMPYNNFWQEDCANGRR